MGNWRLPEAESVRAVWLVQSRRIAPRLAFWLVLAGYDVRDRSRLDIFYIPYLVIFWSVWFFAMLSALAGATVSLLAFLNPPDPAGAAVTLATVAMGGWWAFALFQAGGRSPFRFSGADAQLLCQTPVDRRVVGVFWTMGEWPLRLLPFALGMVTLGFAVFETETVLAGTPEPAELAHYLVAGMEGLLPLLPLHLGLFGISQATGAARLHGRREWWALRWLAPAAALGGLVLFRFWPLSAPLASGLGEVVGNGGLLVAGAWLLAGMVALVSASEGMNLSRAAQETSRRVTQRALEQAGAREAARRLAEEERLGAGRESAPLPAGQGPWALFWKDNVEAWRTGWRVVVPWFGIAVVAAGVAAAPDWPTRIVGLAFWVLWAGNRVSARLRANLAQWWLWRQLPQAGEQLVGMAVGPPLLLLAALGLAATVVVQSLASPADFPIGWLLPLVGAMVALAATFDVLRQVQPIHLLEGRMPAVSAAGWLLGLGLAGLTLLPGWWTARFSVPAGIRLLLSLLAGIVITVIMGMVVRTRARQVV